jgi:hypothetical protein
VDVRKPSELVDKTSFFVHRAHGDDPAKDSVKYLNSVPKEDRLTGTDLSAAALPLLPSEPDSVERLVIGQVAETVQQVTCVWKDGTTTEVHKAPANTEPATDEMAIRVPEGSLSGWFVCVAPQGTTFQSVKVTK